MFKPMLAKDADLATLQFPLVASTKLDGIRLIVMGGVLMSRSLKPLPNRFLQEKFGHLEYYDGEVIVGDPTSKTVYRDTVSHVMSHNKSDYPVTFYAFDHIADPASSFRERFARLDDSLDVAVHQQHEIEDLQNLLKIEEVALDMGFEGLILRDPSLAYKFGRSTVKGGHLLKLKRFIDGEATVVGFEERMHNGNEATTNELGRTQRSSHAAGKSGLGDLGALIAYYKGNCSPTA